MYVNMTSTWYPLICLAIILSYVRAKMIINITKIECVNYAPDLLKNVSCFINQTSGSSGAFSIDFSLTEDLNDIKGHYLLSVKRGSSAIDYFSLDMDFCQSLVSQHSNYFVKTVTNEMRRFTNYPCQCPFKANKIYYIKDFSPDTRILPSYVPEFSFVSETKINYKKKQAMQVNIYGNIVRK